MQSCQRSGISELFFLCLVQLHIYFYTGSGSRVVFPIGCNGENEGITNGVKFLILILANYLRVMFTVDACPSYHRVHPEQVTYLSQG